MGGVMKTFLLAASALVAWAVAAGPAVAADMPVKAPPPVPVYNWTACFVGGSGAKRCSMRILSNATRGRSFGGQSFTGALGAVQFGCDYQAGSFVIGAQGDFGWTDADASTNNLLISTLGNREHVKSLTSGTVRVR